MNIAELHRIRIASDYNEMCQIARSPMVSWTATKGEAPYVEEYLLTIKVRTYSGPNKIMNSCKVRITLPANYPQVKPVTKMEGTLVFHPNWFTDGGYCCGDYRPKESLGNYVVRLIETLQYNRQITNEKSAANQTANRWYLNNRGNKDLFPSDKQPLPDNHGLPGFRVTGRT